MQFKMKTFYVISFTLLFPLLGCQTALDGAMKGFSAGLEGYAEGKRLRYSGTPTKLMLFGGKNNKQYLGCLSCSEYDTDAITNEYGQYGSRYATNSIWNVYGTYGSQYSQYSWRNPYATSPPVVVDESGNFYGYFTENKYLPNRTRINCLVEILDMANE
jgi:hypothetical protein